MYRPNSLCRDQISLRRNLCWAKWRAHDARHYAPKTMRHASCPDDGHRFAEDTMRAATTLNWMCAGPCSHSHLKCKLFLYCNNNRAASADQQFFAANVFAGINECTRVKMGTNGRMSEERNYVACIPASITRYATYK